MSVDADSHTSQEEVNRKPGEHVENHARSGRLEHRMTKRNGSWQRRMTDRTERTVLHVQDIEHGLQ